MCDESTVLLQRSHFKPTDALWIARASVGTELNTGLQLNDSDATTQNIIIMM